MWFNIPNEYALCAAIGFAVKNSSLAIFGLTRVNTRLIPKEL